MRRRGVEISGRKFFHHQKERVREQLKKRVSGKKRRLFT